MSDFVLEPDDVNWKGPTGSQVTVEADAEDGSGSAVLQHVEYPIGTSIPVANGKAVFKLAAGQNGLLAAIRRVAPPVAWDLNEVGKPTGLQGLDEVDSDDTDPYSTDIKITGV
jgi:hypothetical protein